MVDKWIFCALDKSLDRQSFDCGVVELNDYLHRYASQNHRKGIATTFVALANAGDRQIAGYYSVSMAEITITSGRLRQRDFTSRISEGFTSIPDSSDADRSIGGRYY